MSYPQPKKKKSGSAASCRHSTLLEEALRFLHGGVRLNTSFTPFWLIISRYTWELCIFSEIISGVPNRSCSFPLRNTTHTNHVNFPFLFLRPAVPPPRQGNSSQVHSVYFRGAPFPLSTHFSCGQSQDLFRKFS